jgi:hypothetical protein
MAMLTLLRQLATFVPRAVCAYLVDWFTRDLPDDGIPLCDFERIRREIRPGDVLLVEGSSRFGRVVQFFSRSPWSHAALSIGAICDLEDPRLRERVSRFYSGDWNVPLLIEALLSQGVVVTPLEHYRPNHLRVCRPRGLAKADVQRVIAYTVQRLGAAYDIRQVLDLARFLAPWSIIPRRWASSLFTPKPDGYPRAVCSSLLAEAFTAVEFPILPLIEQHHTGKILFVKRNPRLFSPRDFDHSPYFDTLKYPYINLHGIAMYHQLPWAGDECIYNDEREYGWCGAIDDASAIPGTFTPQRLPRVLPQSQVNCRPDYLRGEVHE